MKLSKKTVNNHLTVLRRLLLVAKKRGLIQAVPEIEWLKAPKPEFDFLDFEEAERLIGAAEEGEWRTMILVALQDGDAAGGAPGAALGGRRPGQGAALGQALGHAGDRHHAEEREVAGDRRSETRRWRRSRAHRHLRGPARVLQRRRADAEEERGQASALAGVPKGGPPADRVAHRCGTRSHRTSRCVARR